jgi:hypothetical protein
LLRQIEKGSEKLEFIHGEAGTIIGNLCDCLEQRQQFDQADGWWREWLAAVKRRNRPELVATAADLTEQATSMTTETTYVLPAA